MSEVAHLNFELPFKTDFGYQRCPKQTTFTTELGEILSFKVNHSYAIHRPNKFIKSGLRNERKYLGHCPPLACDRVSALGDVF